MGDQATGRIVVYHADEMHFGQRIRWRRWQRGGDLLGRVLAGASARRAAQRHERRAEPVVDAGEQPHLRLLLCEHQDRRPPQPDSAIAPVVVVEAKVLVIEQPLVLDQLGERPTSGVVSVLDTAPSRRHTQQRRLDPPVPESPDVALDRRLPTRADIAPCLVGEVLGQAGHDQATGARTAKRGDEFARVPGPYVGRIVSDAVALEREAAFVVGQGVHCCSIRQGLMI